MRHKPLDQTVMTLQQEIFNLRTIMTMENSNIQARQSIITIMMIMIIHIIIQLIIDTYIEILRNTYNITINIQINKTTAASRRAWTPSSRR